MDYQAWEGCLKAALWLTLGVGFVAGILASLGVLLISKGCS